MATTHWNKFGSAKTVGDEVSKKFMEGVRSDLKALAVIPSNVVSTAKRLKQATKKFQELVGPLSIL